MRFQSAVSELVRDPSHIWELPWRVSNQLNLWHLNERAVRYNPNGVSIFDRDWDNLVILDAARYDEFAARNTIDGNLDDHRSLGAGSHEFVRANFEERTDLLDTVIVTANAYYEKVRQEQGYDIHDIEVVTEYRYNDLQRRFADAGRVGWNMPQPVTEAAKVAAERYPNKRLIVHYHQPHSPYIGPTGIEYFDELPHKLAYKRNKKIMVSDEILRQAYRENLDIAVEAAAELIETLDGRTVVSADHGEMLGERGPLIPIRYYGHMTGLYTDELTRVPWLVVDSPERKSITSDPPSRIDTQSMSEIEERLRSLGYA